MHEKVAAKLVAEGRIKNKIQNTKAVSFLERLFSLEKLS